MSYGKCKCQNYRSCRCQTDYGSRKVTGIEYLNGSDSKRCRCGHYRTCRCLPRQNGAWAPQKKPNKGVKIMSEGLSGGSRCRCGHYRTCRCLPRQNGAWAPMAPGRGVMPVEAMNGPALMHNPCKCGHYRACRCLPRQNGAWAPQHKYLPHNSARLPSKEYFRGNADPLANAEYSGELNKLGQYVYLRPIPAGQGAVQDEPVGLWKTFGTVNPPFGTDTISYPIQGRVIIPGKLYKYRVLVGNQYYDVQQTGKLINGDVIDILGFYNPVVRWRIRTTNNFWDHKMMKLEERAYGGN